MDARQGVVAGETQGARGAGGLSPAGGAVEHGRAADPEVRSPLPAGEGSSIKSKIGRSRFFDGRIVLVAAVFVVALGLITVDFATWIELNVATVYGLPLVLAGATRNRRLLWGLAALLTVTTFVVYALQTPAGTFRLQDPFFINRVLDVVALLLIATLLHVWMTAIDRSEAHARRIKAQDEKLEAAAVSRRMVEVQEVERQTLANRLHDLVGQKLTALSINLNILKESKARPAPSAAARESARLEESLTLVEETIESIRDVMAELRPAVLDDFGLTPVLRWYAEEFAKRTGVATAVIEQGPTRRLAPAAEEALFRIAQDALANVAKHARARKATVTLGTTPHDIRLSVADDGCGFDPTDARQPARDHGWGLMIMRERAAAVGANFSVDSAPGRGTQVSVTLRGDGPWIRLLLVDRSCGGA